ncbi:MAG: hypothetical protein ACP5I1_14010 [Candidatus Hinthialibacter sp.]
MSVSTRKIEERLKKVIGQLSPKKLEQVADYAEYLRSREDWEATMELLSDPGMRQDIEEGMEQAQKGETHSWREIQKNV